MILVIIVSIKDKMQLWHQPVTSPADTATVQTENICALKSRISPLRILMLSCCKCQKTLGTLNQVQKEFDAKN